MEEFLRKNFNLLRTLIVIIIGIIISVFIIYLMSKYPGDALTSFIIGPFSSPSRLANILEKSVPIILCGLAVSIPFQAGQFYLGAEGSLVLGAAVGTAFAVSTNMPMFLHIPMVLLVAGATGAAWGYIPGLLKAKANANEIVVTLLMNYVAFYLSLFLINFYFRDPSAGFLVSYELPLTTWFNQFVPGTRLHWGILFGYALVFLVYYFLYNTTLGYEIRMTGHNIHFARYGGIQILKIIIISQVLGGFIAGLGGMTEIMGIHRKFTWQSTPGYGWDGIVVAIIGRNNPILLMFAALFLSYLRVGGQILNLQSDIPAEMVQIIQSVIIMLITAEAFLSRWKYQMTIRLSTKKETPNE